METTCIVPTIDEIIFINRRMIERFGGLFTGKDNLRNRDSLEHALWQTNGEMFGQPMYPRLVDKAAMLGWRIISSHVFHDGNKRTGMESCRLMLALNNRVMVIDQETVDTVLLVAQGDYTVEQFTIWVASKTSDE